MVGLVIGTEFLNMYVFFDRLTGVVLKYLVELPINA
jgi:hypothetical protein